MRVLLLCLCPVVAVLAQQKDLSFRQVAGGVFSGYTEDAKAEKAWEASARFMKPSAEEGAWDMEQIQLQSFRDGRPRATFTSPSGVMTPARRSAQGVSAVQARSAGFTLAGRGWSWRSTSQGDSFAILAEVVAELDLAKPAASRLRLRAPRMDAAPVTGGTLLVFQGGVVAEREGERTTCERLECLVADGPGGDATCRSLAASGRVVRVLGKQTLRGDAATFDLKDDTAEMIGHVELEDPETLGAAHRLRHHPKTGRTELFNGDDRLVRLRLRRKPAEVADLTGEHIILTRDPASVAARVEVRGSAAYVAADANLVGRRLEAVEARDGAAEIFAEGDVKGRLEGVAFESGRARWDRRRKLVELAESPHLRDARGLEVAGFTVRSDALNDRLEVRSGPGIRAAVRLPATEAGGVAGLAEADQVVVVTEDGVLQVEMLGAVRYAAGPVATTSDQMVAFALPRAKPAAGYLLSKAILSGRVSYAQPGRRCRGERVDYTPGVQIEEVLAKDALAGRPLLLTLSGGFGPNRPRLFIAQAVGKELEFVADAHEVLHTAALTKFFLRGSVTVDSDGTDATCDLLEGLASPDKEGRLTVRQVVGRGNVGVVAGGVTAKGRTMEMNPALGTARLLGDARLLDNRGNEAVPAKEVSYDLKTKSWRMESAPDDIVPGQVVRPKIFLGRDFTLPEVKSLDKGR